MSDLVTIDEFKSYIGKRSPDNDDTISTIIEGVSSIVKNYCQRTFTDYVTSPKEEAFDGGGHTIFLTEVPVLEISEISERRTLSGDWEVLEEDTDFVVDSELGTVYRTTDSGYGSWPSGPKRVKVVYTGGYEDLPSDLKLAIFDVINYYYKNEYVPRKSFQSVTKESSTTTSVSNRASFPDHITRVLDFYKL